MIDASKAVDAINAHLATKGLESCDLIWQAGTTTPFIITRSTDSTPSYWISLDIEIATCCAFPHEPDDWEHAVRVVREHVETRRQASDKYPTTRVPLGQSVECLCMRDSVFNIGTRLQALSEELGMPLIAIDEDLHVVSAGL